MNAMPKLPALEPGSYGYGLVNAMHASSRTWTQQFHLPHNDKLLLFTTCDATSTAALYMAERLGCDWQRLDVMTGNRLRWAWTKVGFRPYESPQWWNYLPPLPQARKPT